MKTVLLSLINTTKGLSSYALSLIAGLSGFYYGADIVGYAGGSSEELYRVYLLALILVVYAATFPSDLISKSGFGSIAISILIVALCMTAFNPINEIISYASLHAPQVVKNNVAPSSDYI